MCSIQPGSEEPRSLTVSQTSLTIADQKYTIVQYKIHFLIAEIIERIYHFYSSLSSLSLSLISVQVYFIP